METHPGHTLWGHHRAIGAVSGSTVPLLCGTFLNVSFGKEIAAQEGRIPSLNLLDQRTQVATFWAEEGRGKEWGPFTVCSCLGLRLLISEEGRLGPGPQVSFPPGDSPWDDWSDI